MQFDLSTVETATLVFFGTLVVALIVALFMMTAAFAALVLVGAGRLAWIIAARMVLGLARRTTLLWGRMLRRAAAAELAGDFQGDFQGDVRTDYYGHNAPVSGTYPRVALRDS